MLHRLRARLAVRSRLQARLHPQPAFPAERVSHRFGADRGRPVDRFYIERFLAAHRADVRGRVLEVAESTYTQWYGDGDVDRSDVLHHAPGNPEATLVGDLTTGDGIPEAAFDCFICTQTLTFVLDPADAVREMHRLLAPGGVLLCTFAGIAPISVEDREAWGEWWRFTTDSARRLFGDVFGQDAIDVRAHGNAHTAARFLFGYAAEEVDPAQLEHDDPEIELLITVRAQRQQD